MIPFLGQDPGVVRGKGPNPIAGAGESGGREKSPCFGSAKSGSAATECVSGPRRFRDRTHYTGKTGACQQKIRPGL